MFSFSAKRFPLLLGLPYQFLFLELSTPLIATTLKDTLEARAKTINYYNVNRP